MLYTSPMTDAELGIKIYEAVKAGHSQSSSLTPTLSLRLQPAMDPSIAAVEQILGYNFRNKRLLEDALTHPSFSESASYERLEFIGDAVLGLAVSSHIFRAYPTLNEGDLTTIRKANVSNEKLARVAIRQRLYHFVRRRNATPLDDQVREFALAVNQEDDSVIYAGSVKAPKVLADIVESLAGAVYFDVGSDLGRFWFIFRGLLEPIITLEDLKEEPQPVTMLHELCQKHGKRACIKLWRKGAKRIATACVDGRFVASASSEKKEIAKLDAARRALGKLLQQTPANGTISNVPDFLRSLEMEDAKQKLHELCDKKRWPRPKYEIEKEDGLPHEKKYACSVKIDHQDGELKITGDEKTRVKDAKSSAALYMIQALQDSSYL